MVKSKDGGRNLADYETVKAVLFNEYYDLLRQINTLRDPRLISWYVICSVVSVVPLVWFEVKMFLPFSTSIPLPSPIATSPSIIMPTHPIINATLSSGPYAYPAIIIAVNKKVSKRKVVRSNVFYALLTRCVLVSLPRFMRRVLLLRLVLLLP